MRKFVYYFLWVYGKNANVIVQILAIPLFDYPFFS